MKINTTETEEGKYMTPVQEATFKRMAADRGLTVREFAFQTTLIVIRDKCMENMNKGRSGCICTELKRLADEVLAVNWEKHETPRSSTETLVSALRTIASEDYMQSDDGVASMAIREGADRLEEYNIREATEEEINGE